MSKMESGLIFTPQVLADIVGEVLLVGAFYFCPFLPEGGGVRDLQEGLQFIKVSGPPRPDCLGDQGRERGVGLAEPATLGDPVRFIVELLGITSRKSP